MAPPRTQISRLGLRLIVRLLPSCRDMTRLISRGLDAKHTLLTRVQMRIHQRLCVWCARYERQLGRLRATTAHLPLAAGRHFGAGNRLSHAARHRLKQALDDQKPTPL